MKIKIYTWILAVLYALCGVWLYDAVTKFRTMYAEMEVAPRHLTKFILAVGPVGWLAFYVLLAGVIVWKDSHYRSRLPNTLFTALFCGLLAGLVAGLLASLA